MPQEFYVVALASGAAIGMGSCHSDDFVLQQPPDGGTHVKVTQEVAQQVLSEPAAWYVAGGEVLARTLIAPTVSKTEIAADGVDTCEIAGLPDPCEVEIRGPLSVPPTEVTGGSISLQVARSGTYTVTVRREPTYKPWKGTVRAV